MFKELVPILRQRAVLLTVTSLEEDQIRVNIVPKKIKEGDNEALTTPLSVTGTAEDLDAGLSSTIVSFVASHLQLRNTLERAKSEMDTAAKAAQAEARTKSKVQPKKEPTRLEAARPVSELAKPSEPIKSEQARAVSLFDTVAPQAAPSDSESDEEDDIMAEIEEEDEAA